MKNGLAPFGYLFWVFNSFGRMYACEMEVLGMYFLGTSNLPDTNTIKNVSCLVNHFFSHEATSRD